ncbi:N-acetyllactosaminide 3-alpha-galactosyltransferase [Cooperia oncophora]
MENSLLSFCRLLYEGMFGTSSALTLDQFKKTNGFSNRYWGWGGEDDDMYKRIVFAGYKVERYNNTIARYTMIKHYTSQNRIPSIRQCRYKLLEHTKKDWRNDGLNTLNYKVVNITFENLFTHIVVDLLEATERPPLEKVFCH